MLTAKIIFSVNLFSGTDIIAAVEKKKKHEVAQSTFNFMFISSLLKILHGERLAGKEMKLQADYSPLSMIHC